MLLLTALVALVALTTALPPTQAPMPGTSDMGHGPMPTAPCCIGRRWQGTMINLKATDGYKYISTFAEDSTLMRDGARNIDRMSQKVVSTTYTDYKANMTYTVTDGKCTTSAPDHVFLGSCDHPAYLSAQYTGNGTMGGVDPHSRGIFYDAWAMQLPYGQSPLNVTLLLSRDGCVPLLEQVNQRIPNPVDALFLFNDVTTTMVEDALLNVPKECAPLVG